jgi:hypothetical protein
VGVRATLSRVLEADCCIEGTRSTKGEGLSIGGGTVREQKRYCKLLV